jgi:hypothetical protein
MVLGLVLAGCKVDVALDVTMAADGSGAVEVTVLADRDVVVAAPDVMSDVRLDDAAAAGWAVEGPSATPDGGLRVVLRKRFATPEEGTAVLAELNGPQGPFRDLRLSRSTSFARVESAFDGTVQLEGGLAAFADDALTSLVGGPPLGDRVTEEQLASGFAVRVVVRLPGTVGSTNGTVASDGTVTWAPALAGGAATAMHADAALVDQEALDARRNERLAIVGMAVWAVLVIAVLAGGVWWWRRRTGGPAPLR